MKIFLALSCLLAVAVATEKVDYTGYKVIRAKVDGKAKVDLLRKLEDR